MNVTTFELRPIGRVESTLTRWTRRPGKPMKARRPPGWFSKRSTRGPCEPASRRSADSADVARPGTAGRPRRASARRHLASPRGRFQHPLTSSSQPHRPAPRPGGRRRRTARAGGPSRGGARHADRRRQARARTRTSKREVKAAERAGQAACLPAAEARTEKAEPASPGARSAKAGHSSVRVIRHRCQRRRNSIFRMPRAPEGDRVMQPRMNHPAMILPGAMQALHALSAATEKRPVRAHARARPSSRQPDQRLQRLPRHALAGAAETWGNGRAAVHRRCLARRADLHGGRARRARAGRSSHAAQ